MGDPAIFLDRDGVINVSPGQGYVRSWSEFAFLAESREAIRDLSQAGYRLFIISNQSGVGQGLYTHDALNDLTTRMLAAIHHAGGKIDAVMYCTHQETDRCACRKPQRGLIDQIRRQHAVDLAGSYVIGDDSKDIVLGQTIGCRTVLVLSGRTPSGAAAQLQPPPDYLCQDLRAAADWILAQRDLLA